MCGADGPGGEVRPPTPGTLKSRRGPVLPAVIACLSCFCFFVMAVGTAGGATNEEETLGVLLPPNEESLAPTGEEPYPLGGDFPPLEAAAPDRALNPDAAAQLPEQFFGLVSAGMEDEPDWEALARSGASLVRIDFSWHELQVYGWSHFERWVEGAALHGLTILPDLYGRKTEAAVHQFYLKSEETEWNEWLGFAEQMVGHFGYGGSFWKAHGSIPAHPFRVWEVWNEPNLGANDPGGKPLPQKYAEFLSATSIAIHASQDTLQEGNDTKVIFGGVITVKTTEENEAAQSFLRKALTPAYINEDYEGHPKYDGVGVHPYAFGSTGTPASKKATAVVEHVAADRVIVSEMGGASRTLWITEIGWPVSGTGETLVSPQEQAELVKDVFSYFAENFQPFNLKYLAYYLYQDQYVETWDYHAGLREVQKEGPNGTRLSPLRPSWYAYQEETGAAKWPVASTVGAPDPPSYVGSYAVTVSAPIDPHGLSTYAWVEYGTNSSLGTIVLVPGGSIGYKDESINPPVILEGLAVGTTYHYRFVAINENNEVTDGPEGIVTTTAGASAPVMSLDPPIVTERYGREMIVNGGVLPEGRATTVRVEWGSTASYGNTTAGQEVGSGTKRASVTIPVSPVIGQNSYHYRLKATNSAGTTYGLDRTFTTPSWQPLVKSGQYFPLEGLAMEGFSGTINPNGLNTKAWAEFGGPGEWRDGEQIEIQDGEIERAYLFFGTPRLAPNTEYRFRIAAENAEGITRGEEVAYVTPAN
jgi:hypothetical protein